MRASGGASSQGGQHRQQQRVGPPGFQPRQHGRAEEGNHAVGRDSENRGHEAPQAQLHGAAQQRCIAQQQGQAGQHQCADADAAGGQHPAGVQAVRHAAGAQQRGKPQAQAQPATRGHRNAQRRQPRGGMHAGKHGQPAQPELQQRREQHAGVDTRQREPARPGREHEACHEGRREAEREQQRVGERRRHRPCRLAAEARRREHRQPPQRAAGHQGSADGEAQPVRRAEQPLQSPAGRGVGERDAFSERGSGHAVWMSARSGDRRTQRPAVL